MYHKAVPTGRGRNTLRAEKPPVILQINFLFRPKTSLFFEI
jgi:hypothetical protein